METVASLVPNNIDGKQAVVREITKIAHQLQLPQQQASSKLSANQLLDLQARFQSASVNVKRQLQLDLDDDKESKRLAKSVTELLTRLS